MAITRASNPSWEGVMGGFSAMLVRRVLDIRRNRKQVRRSTLEKDRNNF